jgi:hypothetical protein
MHATFLLLCPYHLLPLQVCLLQAEKDLAFLQCPVEVGVLSRLRARDTCLGEEVLLNSLSSDVSGVMPCAHLSKGTQRLQIHLPMR